MKDTRGTQDTDDHEHGRERRARAAAAPTTGRAPRRELVRA
ncbi:hypothetical protein [Pseudokineococcus sp. 1T1Z-3]